MKKLLILLILVSIPFLIYTSALGQNINDQIQNLNFINRIIMQADDCEIFLTDRNNITKYSFITPERITDLKEHIKENDFDKGYDIISIDESIFVGPKKDKSPMSEIVIRSRKNEEIIKFVFKIEKSIWKLVGWGFCLNDEERRPDNDVPCKKK